MNVQSEQPRYLFPKAYADLVQRVRVASGFLLLILFAALANPSIRAIAAGMPLCVVGLMLRTWAAGHLAKNETLATSGPYRWMRNPLYAGTLLAAAGIVIACQSLTLAIVAATVFAFVYLPAIELEEQHLRTIFPVYSAYAARVHRLLPLRRWNAPSQAFSWLLYERNREWKALLGFLVALLWIAWRCWQNTAAS